MIVGGAGVYKEFLPLATRLYLTIIPQEYAGDAYFPEFDETKWRLVNELKTEKFVAKILDRV